MRLIAALILMVSPVAAFSQERNLPEELRGLAVLCSSGASVKFQGDIEGGINRLFGKIVSGSGQLDISESETEFLSSFTDEKLKVEARKVYNECVLGSLQIVYNVREDLKPGDQNPVRLIVPGEIPTIRIGQRFALLENGTALLENGGMIAVQRSSGGKDVLIRVSSRGSDSGSYRLSVGEPYRVPDTGCHVTFYQLRTSGPQTIFSFIYGCD